MLVDFDFYQKTGEIHALEAHMTTLRRKTYDPENRQQRVQVLRNGLIVYKNNYLSTNDSGKISFGNEKFFWKLVPNPVHPNGMRVYFGDKFALSIDPEGFVFLTELSDVEQGTTFVVTETVQNLVGA